jgi:uncharacterized membrane-anchored protein
MARSSTLAIITTMALGTAGVALAESAAPAADAPPAAAASQPASATDAAASDAAAPAAAPATPAVEEVSPEQKLVDAMVMRTGRIQLPGGKASVTIAEGFAYLDEKDTKTLLVDIYGNPPDVAEGTLGVILPTNVSPLAKDSWFAVLTYEGDGHVSDEDAATINYDDLLKEMKESTTEESKERVKAGYGSMQLIGWAQKPSYDAATHKLYWAKELQFGDDKLHTLNYAIRVLGREGVLQLNVVGSIDQLKDINPQVSGLVKMVDFSKGQTYADFNQDTDQVAAYGLAGLIAGGVAAKAGLFKGLIALLLASKKLLIGGLVAFGATIWGGIKWLFGRGNSSES